jgi:hypothetical protein
VEEEEERTIAISKMKVIQNVKNISPGTTCKILKFQDGCYEEFSLLEYKKNSSYLTGDTLRVRYRASRLTLCKT